MRETQVETQQDADQSAADLDQTQSDADQSAADTDQTASDSDQRQADRDQHASDRDQAAADADEEVDATAADVHAISRAERESATRERDSTAAARKRTTAQRWTTATRRDEVGRARDLTAAARDRLADVRDKAADARDRATDARERRAAEAGDHSEATAVLRALRVESASLRAQAALEREAAAADRAAAAGDRDEAAADRTDAGLDDLTGVFRRSTGELALAHEVDRSRRLGLPMVVAMIDVDELKAVNDQHGHAAGDALLRDVVTAITSTTRSYDVTMRWGGDEFVCALADVTLVTASERTARIRSALEELRHGATLSIGFAELQAGDSLSSLIDRADADLYHTKGKRSSSTRASRSNGARPPTG